LNGENLGGDDYSDDEGGEFDEDVDDGISPPTPGVDAARLA